MRDPDTIISEIDHHRMQLEQKLRELRGRLRPIERGEHRALPIVAAATLAALALVWWRRRA